VRLSVVISTFERAAVLSRVLDSLDAQTAAGSFDVVIGVNAADADTASVERVAAGRPYPVRVVQGEVPGVSASRNRGWRSAAGTVILFLGDDMLPAPDLVARHLAHHAEDPGSELGVLGHVRWADELPHTPFMDWLEQGVQFDFGTIRGTQAAWWHLYACNASLKRELLERVGGYDEDFRWGYEDLDLGLRLHHLGFRLLYDREAEVEHLHPPTLEAFRERMRIVAGAERQFVTKHPEADAYFLRRFERAEALPPARSRGVKLARFVPPGLPVIGTRVWFSAARWFDQQLAPAFLQAWREADG
jgi:GT2 family glycosyltransferase